MLNLFLQKEAIGYSWEILTEVYKLPKDRLYVTYFEGDHKNGLVPDEEARQIWLDRGVAEDHILPGNAQDNFWGMCPSIPLRTSHLTGHRNGCNGTMWALQVNSINPYDNTVLISRTAKSILTVLETAMLHIWSITTTQMSSKSGTMFSSNSTVKMMGLSGHFLQSTLTLAWASSDWCP